MKEKMKNFFFMAIMMVFVAACTNSTQTNLNNSNPNEDIQETKLTDTLDQLFLIGSEKELAEVFGAENVIFDTIYVGEGEMSMATILFPESKNQLEILWADMDKREKMTNITHSAYYNMEDDVLEMDSRWETSYGIKLGTSLSELNEINGKAFSFLGFGWDYSGMVTDLNGGALEKQPLNFQLGIADFERYNNDEDYRALLGDMEFTSNNAAAKRLNPVVVLISVSRK